MAVGAGLGAANSLLQTGLGIAQMIKARQYRRERPVYEIPEEIGNRLALRQQQLNARMPGARQMERNLAASAESARYNQQQGAQSSSELLAAAGATQGTTDRSLRDLQIREAQDYENRTRGLEGAQMAMAQARDKEFEINKMQPYMEDSATRAALTEGGFQNLSGGLASLSAQAGKMYEANQLDNSYSDMLDMVKAAFAAKSAAPGTDAATNPAMGPNNFMTPYFDPRASIPAFSGGSSGTASQSATTGNPYTDIYGSASRSGNSYFAPQMFKPGGSWLGGFLGSMFGNR